jgi:hypothetical protein
MQAISAHRGGTSIGGLGERDALIRDMFETQRKQAIIDEFPIGLPEMPEGTRIFRLPDKHGYKHVYLMKRKSVNVHGDTMQEAEHDFIQFETSAVSGFFGQLVLRPDDPKLADGKFAEKVAVVEKLMTDPRYSYLMIVDWFKLREQHEQTEVEKQAAQLADPTWLRKVMEKARKMGISLSEGFGDEQGAE